MTTTDSTDPGAAREQLSALIDGELGDAQATETCLQWRKDAGARAAWHAYQLIGDALRSDDLCSAPGHDAAFLATLRARLAEEPVVLAPQVAAAAAVAPAIAVSAAAGRRGWRTPVAVAAGFVAVVGVVVATRFGGPAGEPSPTLARSDAAATPRVATSSDGALPVSTAANPPSPNGLRGGVASGQLIRDVRLDRYLSAHKQFAGSSALGVPSGFLRNATADAADR